MVHTLGGCTGVEQAKPANGPRFQSNPGTCPPSPDCDANRNFRISRGLQVQHTHTAVLLLDVGRYAVHKVESWSTSKSMPRAPRPERSQFSRVMTRSHARVLSSLCDTRQTYDELDDFVFDIRGIFESSRNRVWFGHTHRSSAQCGIGYSCTASRTAYCTVQLYRILNSVQSAVDV